MCSISCLVIFWDSVQVITFLQSFLPHIKVSAGYTINVHNHLPFMIVTWPWPGGKIYSSTVWLCGMGECSRLRPNTSTFTLHTDRCVCLLLVNREEWTCPPCLNQMTMVWWHSSDDDNEFYRGSFFTFIYFSTFD